MKGFIEVTLPADNEKQLINVQSINLVRSVIWDEKTHTMLLLASAPFGGAPAGVPSELEISETYEQIKALLEQAA